MGLMVVALVGTSTSGSVPWPVRAGVSLAFLVGFSLALWRREWMQEFMRAPQRSDGYNFWVYTAGPAFGAVLCLLALIASLTYER